MTKENSYFYPKTGGKGKAFEFSLEGHRIRIVAEEDKVEERVLVFVDNALFTTLRNDYADIKDTIEVFDHKVLIHYLVKVNSNWMFDFLRDALLNPKEGLLITIDGKPLEGSVADPTRPIKDASIGFYVYAGLGLMTGLVFKEALILSFILSSIFIISGLLTAKMPMLFLPLGIILGLLDLVGNTRLIISGIYAGGNPIIQTMFIFIRIGIILNFIRGIIAAKKLKKLSG